jgi:hypothetical protein
MPRLIDRERLCKFAEELARRLAEEVADEVAATGVLNLDVTVRRQVLGFGDRLLGRAAEEAAEGHWEDGRACPDCGTELAYKQHRAVTIRSVLTGKPQEVWSRYFTCAGCHTGWLEVRAALGTDTDGFTPALQDVCHVAEVLEPYETAAETLLQKVAGVTVSRTKLHGMCDRAGAVAEQLMEEGRLGDSRLLRSDEVLVVEVDGGMVYMDHEWREAKVGITYPMARGQAASEGRTELPERRCVGVIGSPSDFKKRLYQVVEPWLPKDADGSPQIENRLVVLGDGAPWIRNLVEEIFPGATMILDWYHVAEHVDAAVKEAFPDERQRAWYRTRWVNAMKAGRSNDVLRWIANQSMRANAGSAGQEALAGLHGYLDDRKTLLRYAWARAEGLPIGSGAAESAIKNVVQLRMKRPGMRWEDPGVRRMLALRCAYRTSGGLDSLVAAMTDTTGRTRRRKAA